MEFRLVSEEHSRKSGPVLAKRASLQEASTWTAQEVPPTWNYPMVPHQSSIPEAATSIQGAGWAVVMDRAEVQFFPR